MSFSYDRYNVHSRRPGGRTAYGYWIPLGLTMIVATVGLAAWAWKERRDNTDGSDDLRDRRYRDQPDFDMDENVVESIEDKNQDDLVMTRSDSEGEVSSMSSMRNGVSRQLAAGTATVEVETGGRLGFIKVEKDDFRDHRAWSEEAETKSRGGTSSARRVDALSNMSSGKGERKVPIKARKLVAIVISSETMKNDGYKDYEGREAQNMAHSSTLSHLASRIDSQTTQLLVLIFAPHLLQHPLSSARRTRLGIRRSPSAQSSSVNISISDVSDSDNDAPPHPVDNTYNTLYDALDAQAHALVDHETHVIPFTTLTGHIHLLRHLAPSTIYLQDSLAGLSGEIVQQIVGWVGQIVIFVDAKPGIEATEPGNQSRVDHRWWMDDGKIGQARGVEILEISRFGEDWANRIS